MACPPTDLLLQSEKIRRCKKYLTGMSKSVIVKRPWFIETLNPMEQL